jgi:hypothetical protein
MSAVLNTNGGVVVEILILAYCILQTQKNPLFKDGPCTAGLFWDILPIELESLIGAGHHSRGGVADSSDASDGYDEGFPLCLPYNARLVYILLTEMHNILQYLTAD